MMLVTFMTNCLAIKRKFSFGSDMFLPTPLDEDMQAFFHSYQMNL
jgi:hypothetical protein